MLLLNLTASSLRDEATFLFSSVQVLCYGLGPIRVAQEIFDEDEDDGNKLFLTGHK